MNPIASCLASTIDAENAICLWENLEHSQQKQIQQAIASANPPTCIVYPRTQRQLAAVIAEAHRHRWRVLPCGKRSKINWGGLATGIDIVVSTERINQLIAHAVGDLTVTVEAGMQFSQLQGILAQARQFIALDPSKPELATIGGIVATGDTGSLRQRYGSVRDQLLGITFVRSDGQIAKAGGRVVKNVAGYDLMKLFAGAYGTLGIISQVTFRVYPLQEASSTVALTGTPEAICQAAATLRNSALTPTQADLLSTQLVSELGWNQGLGLIARFQSISESVKEQSNRLLAVAERLGLDGKIYVNEHEDHLWQRLRELMDDLGKDSTITCKIGVSPTAAVEVLTQTEMGLIHIGSGLGWLQFEDEKQILKMRDRCQQHRGFVSILTASNQVKQAIDVWGYTGNSLHVMRQIKAQFDSKNILNPGRFVGGI
ncbi:FAD-binding oxidoreductase [Umezakia ovalisporum]|jgi:glycolate oxidase FAD binding subunit|uniref:FAD-binding oxidoreductase n=2 Tax=Umezakia ovalisporum TaxID=75695 RepID=A0AA43GWE1_9CYAN|nr:FAD-binding oxidoreductase [Umezakia ovalisporum]MBI1242355.1 FAD-binding protein [Nostoc sp. RI_552]MDH6056233.1 FAD-binding oxidoreductase [Umezakia ovalisporum FSS-43]MDH6062929.1 FAD-binding oxidoreductase [Umezakia ovalisporum FSS-62]MDH6067811.1 FAD-binding oxidoreductase [Umezakia ovalisporum APH033B]MDH6070881.1 FAD-binding oxidoreductase [Umezakia ovalisporum CobakiLakeA]